MNLKIKKFKFLNCNKMNNKLEELSIFNFLFFLFY